MKTDIYNLCKRRNIPKVDTLRSKIEFVSMIRSQQGKTSTAKGFKELKIKILVEKSNKGNGKIERSNGKSIN